MAHAWWNADWAYRKSIGLNGAETPSLAGPIAQVLVPVRLHAGNFPFIDASATGADLRFVAGDDLTPLNFHIEQFDSIEEIAIAWVQVPAVGAKDSAIWLYYGNPAAPAAGSSKASFDPNTVAAFHFAESEGLPRDATGYGNVFAQSGGKLRAAGAVGFGLGLQATDSLRLAAAPSLATPSGTGWTVSLWVRPAEPAATGALLVREEGGRRLVFGLEGGRPYLRLADGKALVETVAAEPLSGSTWHHVAFALGDRALLYVDGRPAGEGAFRLPEMRGDVIVGAASRLPGFIGEIDVLQISNVMRPPEWFRAAALAQHPQSVLAQYGADESGGGSSVANYLAVLRTLVAAVSLDGWVIIGIIVVMGLIAGDVAIVKARQLQRVGRQNGEFLASFRDPGSAVARMQPEALQSGEQAWRDSSLFRLYQAAQREIGTVRAAGVVGELTPQALEVVRSGIDSSIVDESTRLNSRLVLLTLAVSAAPFLGLLGTVVGIMITFGTIAMAGDVNVNTIAPGVAAALATTVAGLIVAIPAMFGYNVLATRVKVLTSTMELFANELLARLALRAGQQAAAPGALADA